MSRSHISEWGRVRGHLSGEPTCFPQTEHELAAAGVWWPQAYGGRRRVPHGSSSGLFQALELFLSDLSRPSRGDVGAPSPTSLVLSFLTFQPRRLTPTSPHNKYCRMSDGAITASVARSLHVTCFSRNGEGQGFGFHGQLPLSLVFCRHQRPQDQARGILYYVHIYVDTPQVGRCAPSQGQLRVCVIGFL